LVRVVPRPAVREDLARTAPGYDTTGDQLRILATAIQWAEPVDEPVRRKVEPVEESEEEAEDKDRRRRILEKPPEEIS
jgi:hypothetical protein